MVASQNSTVGTVIGIIVLVIAVVGTVFLDWSWANPEGRLLPLAIGIAAAIAGVFVFVRQIRS